MVPGRTIGELIALRASEHPDRPAISAPGRIALDSAGLRDVAARTVATLREHGVGPTDRVALALPNGPEAAVAFLGVASGAICAPLNPSYKENEFAFSFEDLGVAAVLLEEDAIPAAAAAARRLDLPILSLRAQEDDPAGAFELRTGGRAGRIAAPSSGDRTSDPADVALVLHTSGTTARPKIVPLTQRNLCASAANIAGSLALGPADVCLNVMPLFHIHGFMAALMASLTAGGSVVCTPGFHTADFGAWLRRLGPTWYTAVPTIHQAVLRAAATTSAEGSRSTLRLVRSSSAALPVRILRELEALFEVPVVEAYGMTEASHQMASNPIAAGAQKPGSVGPAAGPEIAVLDESGRLLEPGVVGEIAIRGETVTRGYERNPDANASAFVDGWFRTGDQGYIDADGYVFLTGRLKELINRGGEKIAPREVEEALLHHPAIAQAVAFAAPHSGLGEEVAAAIVLREGTSATADEIRRAAGDHLADFKVPRRIAIVPEIPKGATGKVQRLELARTLGFTTPERAGTAPRSPLEQTIAETWARLLALGRDDEPVGIEDDFFDLGGDSLAAVEMIDAMCALLDFDVPIADFLEHPTIAHLIELRDRAVAFAADGPSGLVPIRSGEDERPLFCTSLHDGSFWRAARLVRHLRAGTPVYGFRAPSVSATGPLQTIEQLADTYLTTLESVQPDGPVRLLGPCFGGTVALEMAIRLERRGRPVELLAMVNSFNRAWRNTATHGTPLGRAALRARHAAARLRLHAERLHGRAPPEQRAYLRERLDLARVHWTDEASRLLFELATTTGLPRPARVRKIGHASRHAQLRYEPGRYAGDVLMVRAIAPIAGVYPLPLMGWEDVLVGDVKLVDFACEQLEFWNDDPILARVAARIDDVLTSSKRSAA